jgi:hypothetical protein
MMNQLLLAMIMFGPFSIIAALWLWVSQRRKLQERDHLVRWGRFLVIDRRWGESNESYRKRLVERVRNTRFSIHGGQS